MASKKATKKLKNAKKLPPTKNLAVYPSASHVENA